MEARMSNNSSQAEKMAPKIKMNMPRPVTAVATTAKLV